MPQLPPLHAGRLLVCGLALALGAGLSGCLKGSASTQPVVPVPPSLFADVTAASHVSFNHKNGQGAAATIMSTTGTGCAVFDYDNDGWLDLYLVNGQSPPGDGNHLYHNNHDGTYTDVTAQAGVAGLNHGFGMGCAVGDYDGDGYLDLFVTYFGKNILFHNEGNGKFKDVTASAGLAGEGFSTAAAFADLDGDGYPDLYTARYVKFDKDSKQLCINKGVPTSCPPYFYTPQPDLVYHNDGRGHFTDVTKAWGLYEETGRGLGITIVDYNNDGKPDIFVANDGSPNFLYRNLGKGKFKSAGAVEGLAFDSTGRAVSNMGCDFGDFFGDGSISCITGVFQNEVHPLWRYTPATGFQHMSDRTGIRNLTYPLLTFGIGFADLDNDGWPDILMANGHVQDRVEEFDKSTTYAQPRTYLHNTGKGTVEDWTAKGGSALTQHTVGRGLSFGDLDNDGDIDLVLNNSNGPAMVVRNDHPKQNWATLRLIGREPNWEADGARVELEAGGRKQNGFVHTSYSFASMNDPRVHFGLGSAAKIDRVTVHWLDGKTTTRTDVPINAFTTLVEEGAHPPAAIKPLLTGTP